MHTTWAPIAVKVAILGADGMLAQAMRCDLDRLGVPYAAANRQLVDVCTPGSVKTFLGDCGATHVLNCAAYTKVDACESHEEEAAAVNGRGPGNVAAAASTLGLVAVHISTDYVFGGEQTQPYLETDRCAPLGAYGRTKHLGEQNFWRAWAPQEKSLAAFVVRTSWLYGRGGPNFVKTMLRLMAERPKLDVVADQQGSPTLTTDLAEAVLKLCGIAATAAAGGVYHFANKGITTWHGFAEAILTGARQRGMAVTCQGIRAIRTVDYPTPAKRPAWSVLSTEKITQALGSAPRAWQQALDDYLADAIT